MIVPRSSAGSFVGSVSVPGGSAASASLVGAKTVIGVSDPTEPSQPAWRSSCTYWVNRASATSASAMSGSSGSGAAVVLVTSAVVVVAFSVVGAWVSGGLVTVGRVAVVGAAVG